VSPGQIVVAGLVAGAAFALVLEADLRLTGNKADDFVILGRPFVKQRQNARALGAVIHAGNSIALAALYARVQNRLPGPPWLKGVLFANIENTLLYPITVFEDLHPAIQDGQVDRYFTWPSFWQSVPRHIAYGAVLGALIGRVEQSRSRGVRRETEGRRPDGQTARRLDGKSANPIPRHLSPT
jgi:hypothetical protein